MSETVNGFVLPETRTKKRQVTLEINGNALDEQKLTELRAELKTREEENNLNPPEK